VPTASELVVKLAAPSETDKVASVVDPSLMVTLPVGENVLPETYWTAAEIVTAVPTFAGFGVAESASVSGTFAMTIETGDDCDGIELCCPV